MAHAADWPAGLLQCDLAHCACMPTGDALCTMNTRIIDELRIYTLVAGALPEYLELAEKVAVPIRGDSYGRLLKIWHGEIGAANRVFNIWRHKDLNTRQAVRVELEALEAWRNDYVAKVRPLMQQQVIRFMTPVDIVDAPETGNLYDVRIFRSRVGQGKELASRIVVELPAADGVCPVGVWTTFAGSLHEVVHISAYRDWQVRSNASLVRDPWRGFLARHGSLIEEIDSTLMLPAVHSPWQ